MKMKQLIDVIPDYLTSGIFNALDSLDVPWKSDIDGNTLDLEYMGNISGSKKVSPLIIKILADNDTLTAENITTIANLIYKINIKNWNALYDTLSFEYNPISNYDMVETETASGTTSDTRLNTGTQTTTATGTQATAHTGTAETEHTGTQGTTSTSSANGSSTGSTESNIFGFNSSTSVGDSDGETTATTTNSANGSETRTDNLTDTRTDNLTDTRTDNLTNQRTDNLSESVSGSNSSNRRLTRSGNIGVTTSQQMIQSERDLWLWNFFYNVVFKDIDKVTTIATY